MRIIYVGRHDRPHTSNDEEGAISHALTKLGHDVVRVPERNVGRVLDERGDLLLFHHWDNYIAIDSARMKRVFWCFDLIEFDKEPILLPRFKLRKQWAERVTNLCDFGFLTDGEYVSRDKTGRLHWLCQGADERRIVESANVSGDRILFMGTAHHGEKREQFVKLLSNKYPRRFVNIRSGVHGNELIQIIGDSGIVIAPDGPVADRYWSNRVYLTLGYGGFLLHPYCDGLTDQYSPSELVTYRSRTDMTDKIEYYTEDRIGAVKITESGLARTRENHTYTHRCRELLKIVEGVV